MIAIPVIVALIAIGNAYFQFSNREALEAQGLNPMRNVLIAVVGVVVCVVVGLSLLQDS